VAGLTATLYVIQDGLDIASPHGVEQRRRVRRCPHRARGTVVPDCHHHLWALGRRGLRHAALDGRAQIHTPCAPQHRQRKHSQRKTGRALRRACGSTGGRLCRTRVWPPCAQFTWWQRHLRGVVFTICAGRCRGRRCRRPCRLPGLRSCTLRNGHACGGARAAAHRLLPRGSLCGQPLNDR
jgi:hypothetical protein